MTEVKIVCIGLLCLLASVVIGKAMYDGKPYNKVYTECPVIIESKGLPVTLIGWKVIASDCSQPAVNIK